MQAVWDDFRLELDEALDLADRVLALVRVSGRGRLGGVPVEAKVAHLWTVRRAKAMRLETSTDWEERERPSVDACPTASTVHLAAELPAVFTRPRWRARRARRVAAPAGAARLRSRSKISRGPPRPASRSCSRVKASVWRLAVELLALEDQQQRESGLI